ncbi:unnamed protein product, partial [Clonostachys rhizophaga]
VKIVLANAAPLIVELAAKITSLVAELQVGLAAQGLENPSWAENSPPYLPSNLHQLRDKVLDTTAELHKVLLEPLKLIYKVAGKTNLNKRLVRRLLRHAISIHILIEPEPDVVAHTKTSKFLAIPYIGDWATFESHDTWLAIPRIGEAIEKWPYSEEANETVSLDHVPCLTDAFTKYHEFERPLD